MCLNRQVDSIRITLHQRNLHRIENGLVRFSVNRVLHMDIAARTPYLSYLILLIIMC